MENDEDIIKILVEYYPEWKALKANCKSVLTDDQQAKVKMLPYFFNKLSTTHAMHKMKNSNCQFPNNLERLRKYLNAHQLINDKSPLDNL